MVSTDRIRNVVLVGHNGNGKTSLVEAMLYRAGVLNRPGRIEQGNTVMDHDPEERERQQSLSCKVTSFEWKGHKVNLIDTPGYADFTGEVLMGMSVAELAVFVIDGVAGVQAQDVMLWRHAERMGLPRMFFVNKLDRHHSSFDRTLQQLRSTFSSHADPIELPIGEESSFHGLADLLTDHAFFYDSGKAEDVPIPDEIADQERLEHQHLVDEVIELDDDLLEKYLDGTEPTPEQLERLLHDAMDAAQVFPVLCGSATTPIGADQLIDLICRIGPAPGEVRPTQAEAGGTTVEISPDPEGDPLVYVFKTKVDDFLGQISIFKVLSGKVRTDQVLFNSRSKVKERLHQLVAMSGSDHRPISEVVAGDIGAVAKLSDTRTGDTLAPEGKPIVVPAPRLPQPVHGVVIQPMNQADHDRLSTVTRRLVAEDPTLSVGHDEISGRMVLSGRGDTHVQVALSRIARMGVEVQTEDVQVAYRETLAAPVEVEGKYKKQSGGHGQFGVAIVRFEPLPRGSGFEFDSEVTGGAIPRNLIPAVGAGIEEAMARGGKYGFPLVDIRAVCVDGKHHPVDSSEMSFKMAGSLALREAVEKAGVLVLEPISEIWVHAPSQHQGQILGDLNARRGQVLGTETGESNDITTIHALVPTSEITRYAIDLQSMAGGTGSFEVSHHGYQEMPPHLVERLEPAR